MGSISHKSDHTNTPGACEELLSLCLSGRPLFEKPWSTDLLDRAIAEDSGRAFFSIVVERLGDLFEPRLCTTYVRLFDHTIARVWPGWPVQELEERYRKIREPHTPPSSVDRVYVLSRVTLGADVAVTSVMLDAAKHRYPDAKIVLVGARKSFELFEGDPRVAHLSAPYARAGVLEDRLYASIDLAKLLATDGAGVRSIVIDPDSRLSQLGLIPVCEDENYFFFESRGYGGAGLDRLPHLAARWAHEVFGVEGARPYIAPREADVPAADITVSLGVGENEAKRLDDAFERDLLRALADTGASVLVDEGGSAAERERVERALLPGIRTHQGAFGVFAALIQKSRLYVGYDSAGGHVASACGVPVISIAKGFASDRMAARWRPNGLVLDGSDAQLWNKIRDALAAFRRLAPDA